ncbi:MAG: HAD family hydrolase, partial [Myxococcales bacterium]|nr:HAD family hydrolase [Myxococcales bacterium]
MKIDALSQAVDLLQEAGYSFNVEDTHQVYVNRDLRMSEVEWVGFDMDYTLARYHQDRLDELSVRHTVDTLVDLHGYPEILRKIEPRPDFAIRGLVLDTQLGNLLKMDSHGTVGRAFHGLRPAPESVQQYHDQPVRLSQERYVLVDTLFALPEIFLYAAIVQQLEDAGRKDIDFVKIYRDVRAAIDLAHADGRIKRDILADLEKYVIPDPDLGRALHNFRSAGKKLFLLTNS